MFAVEAINRRGFAFIWPDPVKASPVRTSEGPRRVGHLVWAAFTTAAGTVCDIYLAGLQKGLVDLVSQKAVL